MFEQDENIKFINATPENIATMMNSINTPMVAVAGSHGEPSMAYIVTVRDGKQYSTYIYLHVLSRNIGLIYKWDEGPLPKETLSTAELEALRFTEEMGFMMDNMRFGKKAPEEKAKIIETFPCFHEDLAPFKTDAPGVASGAEKAEVAVETVEEVLVLDEGEDVEVIAEANVDELEKLEEAPEAVAEATAVVEEVAEAVPAEEVSSVEEAVDSLDTEEPEKIPEAAEDEDEEIAEAFEALGIEKEVAEAVEAVAEAVPEEASAAEEAVAVEAEEPAVAEAVEAEPAVEAVAEAVPEEAPAAEEAVAVEAEEPAVAEAVEAEPAVEAVAEAVPEEAPDAEAAVAVEAEVADEAEEMEIDEAADIAMDQMFNDDEGELRIPEPEPAQETVATVAAPEPESAAPKPVAPPPKTVPGAKGSVVSQDMEPLAKFLASM